MYLIGLSNEQKMNFCNCFLRTRSTLDRSNKKNTIKNRNFLIEQKITIQSIFLNPFYI